MRNAPSNTDDVIDSRDIIARIEELQEVLAEVPCSFVTLASPECSPDCPECKGCGTVQPTVNDDDVAELAALLKLADEAEGCAADWKHGETLIRDSYFRDYAEELAEDIGAINHEASWPNNCIDWDRACWELQMDYTSVDFDGVTYWVR